MAKTDVSKEVSPTVAASEFPRKGLVYAMLIGMAALIITNLALVFVSVSKSVSPSGMSAVDRTCVAVLHNGGVPEDCSRMYHLSIFP